MPDVVIVGTVEIVVQFRDPEFPLIDLPRGFPCRFEFESSLDGGDFLSVPGQDLLHAFDVPRNPQGLREFRHAPALFDLKAELDARGFFNAPVDQSRVSERRKLFQERRGNDRFVSRILRPGERDPFSREKEAVEMVRRVQARPFERPDAERLQGGLGQEYVLGHALGKFAVNEPADIDLAPCAADALFHAQDLDPALVLLLAKLAAVEARYEELSTMLADPAVLAN